MSISFARPEALWLFILVPLLLGAGLFWRHRTGRPARSPLMLRATIVVLLLLGLAEPLLATSTGAGTTIFVLDRSRSLAPDTRATADRWLRDALAGGDGRAAVIATADRPTLAAAPAPARQLGDQWATINPADPNFTDLESGLALARALPVGSARRIVLISDGAENVGRALEQAALAAVDGTPIDVLPLDGIGASDLRVEGVTVPASSWVGDTVTVLATVYNGVAGPGRIALRVDGAEASVIETDLPAGTSSQAFTLTDLAPGFHALEVRVAGPAGSDRFVENNAYPASHVVRDQPRILVVAPPDNDSGVIRGALARGGARVEVIEPLALPARISELSAYDAFVLDNVPASAFTVDQVAGLAEVTGSLGRGLVVLGGTSSFGPGAYAGSKLEDVLPVTVRATDGRQRQRVALLLVMDKSGSMSYDPRGEVAKIEMAKEAARLAARALVPGDQIGVLMFNDKQEWAVPFTVVGDAADQQRIDEQIAAITSSGGTEILPALAVGLDAIRNADAEVRHIILVSDGKSRTGRPENYLRLIREARADRTSLSTIATGEDADRELLERLATEGGGRFHLTTKAEEIPVLTVEEAASAGSQSVIRGSFQPIQTAPSPILTGSPPETLPLLDGYDFTEAKPDAQVDLVSDRNDPVLARWQYGLGRVIAWTADNGADLAAPWATWDQGDAFWSAMVRWALPDPDQRPLRVSTALAGPTATISVSTNLDQDLSRQLAATITSPTGEVLANQPLTRNGPGAYRLQVPAPAPGAYQIALGDPANPTAPPELAAFAVPPSPELQPAPGATELLRGIAQRTGGRVLSLDDPTDVFAPLPTTGGAPRDIQPVWPAPVALALGLFVLDIARRMGITWQSLTRLWAPRA